MNAPPDTISRKIGVCLVQFAARVCGIKFGEGRHLLVEDPVGPDFLHLQCFPSLFSSGETFKVNMFQCGSGLVTDGQPTCNNTS